MTAAGTSIATIGARTPLGMRAAPSAAAIRAGISAVVEMAYLRDKLGDPIPMALDTQLEPDLMGAERLLRLAEGALQEACLPLGQAASTGFSVPAYVGLPEFRPGFTVRELEAVRRGLADIPGFPVGIRELKLFPQGHAAGLVALASGAEAIRRGACEVCLAGGVDSYYKPETLEWLDEHRQLSGADSRSSFVPGEGAGFCLLVSDRMRDRLGWATMARLHTVHAGHEAQPIKTDGVCLGEGLTSTVRAVVGNLSDGETINSVICDINGERYRSEEWGFVCLRMSQYFDDPADYVSPADCWGDLGAASGPLFAMLACQAAERGYSKGPRTLLWASSEGGLRAAALLATEEF